MREALTEFIQETRAAGLRISVAESIDALRAAVAAGVERERLREALATALVKDETDRDAFDEVFERFFSAGSEAAKRARRKRGSSSPGLGRSSGEGDGALGRREVAKRPAHEPYPKALGVAALAERAREPKMLPPSQARGPEPLLRSGPAGSERARAERSAAPERRREEGRRIEERRRARSLLRKPFKELAPDEAEDLALLAAEIAKRFRARVHRRLRRGKRGRLDFRRTLRRSIAHGGAPFDLELRKRRRRRPDLFALCDVSGSVRHASEFFVALLRPAAEFFRRVRIVVFVDRPIEASIEDGRLLPESAIDFHAFSDFGRTFVEVEETFGPSLGRNTVLVVLGDARTNRKPPRADALAKLHSRVRSLWWLNPESLERWGTGDSAIERYRPHTDELLACADAAGLVAALGKLTR